MTVYWRKFGLQKTAKMFCIRDLFFAKILRSFIFVLPTLPIQQIVQTCLNPIYRL